MSRLEAAVATLDIDATVELAGTWIEIKGERCRVFVVEAARNGTFYTWCDVPDARAVQAYDDPVVAIQAGLRRAARSAHRRQPEA